MENKYQYCNWCKERKALFLFPLNVKSKGGYSKKCKKCENSKQQIARDYAKNWKYPYKGFNDPKYIVDKAKCFAIQAKKARKEMGLEW